MKFYKEDKSITSLSMEDFKANSINNYGSVPIFYSKYNEEFSVTLAKKLNKMFRRSEESELEQIESLGRDFDGDSSNFEYQLGRKEIISSDYNSQPTIKDTTLSVEHVRSVGIGLYNILREVAGICKGVPNAVIYLSDIDALSNHEVDFFRDMVVRTSCHLILILILQDQSHIPDIKIYADRLYDLMEETNHVTVFITYIMCSK